LNADNVQAGVTEARMFHGQRRGALDVLAIVLSAAWTMHGAVAIECEMATYTATQSVETVIQPGAGTACVILPIEGDGLWSGDNTFARVYEIQSDRSITCINTAIEENLGELGRPLTLNVRALNRFTVPPVLANTTLLYSTTTFVPGLAGMTPLKFDVEPDLPVAAGDVLVIEITWATQDPELDRPGVLLPGANELGQSAPTYFIADRCSFPDYVDMAHIGFPGLAVLISYNYVLANACPADITGSSGGEPDGNVDALDLLLLISQWGSPCTAPCEADITGYEQEFEPDGNVDAVDFLILIAQWGSPGGCPTP
jgi:hypothetical protein